MDRVLTSLTQGFLGECGSSDKERVLPNDYISLGEDVRFTIRGDSIVIFSKYLTRSLLLLILLLFSLIVLLHFVLVHFLVPMLLIHLLAFVLLHLTTAEMIQ